MPISDNWWHGRDGGSKTSWKVGHHILTVPYYITLQYSPLHNNILQILDALYLDLLLRVYTFVMYLKIVEDVI